MTLIRPGRTGFRGRRAAEADAPFFEDSTGSRTGEQARPASSISSAEEAESRALWARALTRQKLRGALTRTEKIAGGVYAAALMVLLGHEWPHHANDAAHDSAPTPAGGHIGPEGRVMPAAAPGDHVDATSLAGADGLLQNVAYEGGVDLRKFAPGTTIIPSTLLQTPGDHDSGSAGGAAAHPGQAAELAAVHNADPIATVREMALPTGNGFGDIASIGGDIPAATRTPSQGTDSATTTQAQQAKAASPAAAPADSSQSQGPAKAQSLAATTGTTQDHGQSQTHGDNAGGTQDTASGIGTAPGHAQDNVLAQSQDAAVTLAATAGIQDQGQGPAKAQDTAMTGATQSQADSTDTAGLAKDHGQGHAKTQDTASVTADASHSQGDGSAKPSDLTSGLTVAATVTLGQGQAKAQDIAAGTDSAKGQDHGNANSQDPALSTADATHGQGNSAAKAQDSAQNTADATHGQGPDKTQDATASADATHGQGDSAAKAQDPAATTADSTHGQGPAKAQDTTATADTTHGQGNNPAQAQDPAQSTADATHGQSQDHSPAKAQDSTATADASHDQGNNAKAQDPAVTTADSAHGQGNGAKAQDVADSTAGTAQDHGQGHGNAQGQNTADAVVVQGGDHGSGHSDHADAFLLQQAGHADATDALSNLLNSVVGADASVSAHVSAALPEDSSVHGHLHASATHDLTLL